jgi:hypothetical protein
MSTLGDEVLEPATSALEEPFQALATKHLRYMHLAAAAVQHRQPAAAAAPPAEPSRFGPAYEQAVGALKIFFESEYIADFLQADTEQLGGIVALLHAFSVNARRMAAQADLERSAQHGFVDPTRSCMQNVSSQLQRNFAALLALERRENEGGDSERAHGAASAMLVTINQLLKVYAFEHDWSNGPDVLHNWARGRRGVKRKAEGQAAGNAYQKMGRSDFLFGNPNKNCMPPGWSVDASDNAIYLQQYRNAQSGQRRFSLPIDGCPWFARSHVVSYLFLLGKRVLIYDDSNDGIPRYVEAHEILRRAFDACHRTAARNKRHILSYLVPVSLLCGRLPSAGLLRKHGMPTFYGGADHILPHLADPTLPTPIPFRNLLYPPRSSCPP